VSGLSLKVGGFGGVGSTATPAYGTQDSYNTVTSAAFGPGSTVQVPSTGDIIAPNDGFGLAFTTGVIAVVLLVVIRHSLPGK
jgi:hypothetical protein